MKIGIIIYSETGHTREVAGKLEEKLIGKGHQVSIEEITIAGKTPAQAGQFELSGTVDSADYDAVVFGSPVQAFNLNPVMRAYLERLPVMQGKEAACFITKQIPVKMTGGTQAAGKMKSALEQKGVVVKGMEIVFWSAGKRQESIAKAVDNLSALF